MQSYAVHYHSEIIGCDCLVTSVHDHSERSQDAARLLGATARRIRLVSEVGGDPLGAAMEVVASPLPRQRVK